MAVNGKGRPTKAQKAESERVNKWLEIISTYDREFEKWQRRSKEILKRYRDEFRTESTGTQAARFNILWSNVQTLVPATAGNGIPQPDVSRRFRDNDPVARVGGMILERALDFEIQHYPDYRETLTAGVYDRFLGGRGTSWIRSEAEIADDGDGQETLVNETAPIDYVQPKDFGHTVARTWAEVTAVWRYVYMTREACIARFGEDKGAKIPLDSAPETKPGDYKAEGAEERNRAQIIEIWDKDTMSAIWLNKSMKSILDEQEDPLGLEQFFPCPKPIYSTLTNDCLIPVPDFALYQDQANTLDILCDRIDGLCKMLQVKGVYDGSADPAVGRLFTEGANGNLIAVKNWAAFAEKNGLKGQVDVYDITPIFNALREAYGAMEQQKQQVYEITGLSDIVRGQTQASETLGAQEIKKNFVGLRLGSYKQEVALYATDILRLKAEIICQMDPQTIAKMASVEALSPEDQALVPAALELLKNEPLRNFRVDIAADTLVQMDEEKEQESRVQFGTVVGQYLVKAVEATAQAGPAAPVIGPLSMDLLKFVVTGFKVGKQVEGAIDKAAEEIRKLAAVPPPPKPDPEMAKIQAEQQRHQMQLQADQQANQQKLQTDQAAEQMRTAAEERAAQVQLAADTAKHDRELAAKVQIARFEAEIQQQTELEKVRIQTAAQIEIAQISAQAKKTENEETNNAIGKPIEKLSEMHAQSMDESGKTAKILQELAVTLSRPKKVVRGADGKVSGIQ